MKNQDWVAEMKKLPNKSHHSKEVLSKEQKAAMKKEVQKIKKREAKNAVSK